MMIVMALLIVKQHGFNDITSGGSLPVKYTNNHSTSLTKGDPFTKIPEFNTLEYKNSSTWSTHCNPNNNPACVGTDMTYYKVTSADTGNKVTISPDYFDGRGSTANIGNWMVDYLDHITLVNQGSREREVTYKLKHNGVILAFVRDENGEIKNDYPLSYKVSLATSEYGAELRDYFEYKIKVPAHSIVRYVVDYNLLANSSGYIEHGATLND